MGWFLSIIGLVILFLIINKLFGGSKNIEKYGPPSYFLKNIIDKLIADFPRHQTIAENAGRIKIKFQSQSFSLTTDFIYMNDHIQVCLTFNSMLGSNRIKTFKCPYDPEIIEQEIGKNYLQLLGHP